MIESITKKYRPLYEYLSHQSDEYVELDTNEIEGIIKAKLPKTATGSTAGKYFWNNDTSIERKAWLEAGYEVGSFDPRQFLIRFRNLEKKRAKASAPVDRPIRKSGRVIKAPHKKTLECWFCKKDDIKYGATVCSGCQAQIIYETHSSKASQEKLLFWLYFIGLLIGITFVVGPIAKVFFGGLDDATIWLLIVAPSVVGAIFLTFRHQKKKSEDNLVCTIVTFKKPKAKGGFIIGTTFGEDN